MKVLDADATAQALGWPALEAAIEATIADANAGLASCPPRVSLPLTADGVWLLMPAVSSPADVAACKLVTVHPGNAERGLPNLQGSILVIRASTGKQLALLDGPTVTARRTAAVTVIAIRRLLQARAKAGPGAPAVGDSVQCLIIGCGVQGRSHLEAIHAAFPGTRFVLSSRSPDSATRLAARATVKGIAAHATDDLDSVLAVADMVVCCTPALEICLYRPPREGAIIAAIGSFTPQMSELGPEVMKVIGRNILLDSADARHEAGELVQAGVDPEGLPSLLDWSDDALPTPVQTVLFKSCGSGLWDLAAAQAATAGSEPVANRDQ